ncbi:hypothetical protein [Cupriavidus sp. TMH.W2]|uniref:hypothetical protein n=1 Tax=Cupriavidus sp. TMH.W2 TaxID=3434465 RepID=UPI003D782E29
MAEALDLDTLARLARSLRGSARAQQMEAATAIDALIARIRELERAASSADQEEDARDAKRWRTALRFVGAWLSGGRRQTWSLEPLPIPAGVNLMQGSVAEHFTQAIDAAMSASKEGA